MNDMRRIRVFLDPDMPPDRITAHPSWSRWAAFTDNELNRIGRGLLSLEFHAIHTSQPARLEPQQLRDEISREIERRKNVRWSKSQRADAYWLILFFVAGVLADRLF